MHEKLRDFIVNPPRQAVFIHVYSLLQNDPSGYFQSFFYTFPLKTSVNRSKKMYSFPPETFNFYAGARKTLIKIASLDGITNAMRIA